jgi:hypothetical protein
MCAEQVRSEDYGKEPRRFTGSGSSAPKVIAADARRKLL